MSGHHALSDAPDAEPGDRKAMQLSSLTPDPHNARQHDEGNLSLIEAALCEVGTAPIRCDRRGRRCMVFSVRLSIPASTKCSWCAYGVDSSSLP